MDSNQTRIIELLREVHLIAIKEIKRLNMRITELENQIRQLNEKPVVKQPQVTPAPVTPAASRPMSSSPSSPKSPEPLLNEMEVAEYLKMSVASVCRWRLFRTGPKFVKIGASVRYRRGDVETWLDSRPGLG